MITKAIMNAIKFKESRGWDLTYWAFDIHETIIEPNYTADEIPTKFYPLAKEVLQKISKRDDVRMLLYTCSHPREIVQYIAYFKENGIDIKYVNENPEVPNGAYGCYDDKPYFNVLFEDKSGFDPYTDWAKVDALLDEI